MNTGTSGSVVIPPATRQLKPSASRRIAGAMGIFAGLLALLVVVAVTSPRLFTPENLLNILRSVTLLGLVSIGAAFVTYGRHYVDLSIPQIMATSGMVTVSALPLGIAIALALGLLAGMCIGTVNGFVIGYKRVNPIIWTLAIAFFFDGLIRWLYHGNQVYPDADTAAGAAFLSLAQLKVLRFLPLSTATAIVAAIVGHLLMRHTRFGAEVRLTGSAYNVAKLSGVHVRRIVFGTFLLNSITASVAGIFLTSMNRQGTFDTGAGYDFNTLTAVVLGGVRLEGGSGSMIGVVGAVLFIGVLANYMTLMGVGSFGQMLAKGAVFILAVAVAGYLARRSGGRQ